MIYAAILISLVLGYHLHAFVMGFTTSQGKPCLICRLTLKEAREEILAHEPVRRVSVAKRFRPMEQAPAKRTPRYALGDKLRNVYGFVGTVDAVYADFQAAVDGSGSVDQDWFNAQDMPPSTWDQVFYSVVNFDTGLGAILLGEAEAELVT